jgi:hypothetical protein
MSGADIGGDGSVKWNVVADHVRGGTVKDKPKGAKGREQGGVDETDANEKFTISIKIPSEKTDFVATLEAAAAAARTGAPGSRVWFTLPIEEHNEDQIQVTWNSKQPNAVIT